MALHGPRVTQSPPPVVQHSEPNSGGIGSTIGNMLVDGTQQFAGDGPIPAAQPHGGPQGYSDQDTGKQSDDYDDDYGDGFGSGSDADSDSSYGSGDDSGSGY